MGAVSNLATLFPPMDAATISSKGFRHYKTPEGDFPSVTTVLKILGLGTEGLIAWSGREERKIVLAACAEVCADENTPDAPAEFVAAVEAHLGTARAHQRLLNKAAEIGTSIHEAIQWTLRVEIGEDPGPKPQLTDPAEVAFMSWSDWWASKGLRAVRVEQPIWNADEGYAGTIDLIAEGPEGLELWDWKSSAGVYEGHHIQAAAYVVAANRWAPVRPGGILHLPKDLNGDLEVKEHRIGDLYGGKKRTVEELFRAFCHTVALWNMFVRPEGKE